MTYEIIADDGVHPPIKAILTKSRLKQFMGEAIHTGVIATQKIENEYHHGDENFPTLDVPDELLLIA